MASGRFLELVQKPVAFMVGLTHPTLGFQRYSTFASAVMTDFLARLRDSFLTEPLANHLFNLIDRFVHQVTKYGRVGLHQNGASTA